MTVYEVDEQGFVIESYLVNEIEIKQLINSGKNIVEFGWGERLFKPKYDFKTNAWVEGLTADEVAEKEKGIVDHHNKIADEEMNAIAIMELTQMVLGR